MTDCLHVVQQSPDHRYGRAARAEPPFAHDFHCLYMVAKTATYHASFRFINLRDSLTAKQTKTARNLKNHIQTKLHIISYYKIFQITQHGYQFHTIARNEH